MHPPAEGGMRMWLKGYVEGLSYGADETFESGIEKLFSLIMLIIMLYVTLVPRS